ncbi:MAG: universal stress protein [Chlorobi bacterium]|nr:universal stress protein [Chlorobiota bacterium]
MIRFDSILIPTDFSECARYAEQYGLELGRMFGSALYYLYAVEPIDTFATINGVEQSIYFDVLKDLRASAEERLGQIAAELSAQGLTVHTAVREGRASEAIVEYAQQNAISLICIATHGRRGFSHLILGSTTERVVRRAPCPVFVVRAATP